MKFDAMEEHFEKALIDGREVLFTNIRIDRSTVPENLYCYDIREMDGFSGVAASVERYVWVNHWGTILSKEAFPLENGRYEIISVPYAVRNRDTCVNIVLWKVI